MVLAPRRLDGAVILAATKPGGLRLIVCTVPSPESQTGFAPPQSISSPRLVLPLVFAFAQALQDGEPGLLGVGDGNGLQFDRRVESGDHFAHGLFAGRTSLEFRRAQGAAEGELPAADHATACAQFIFIERHRFTSCEIRSVADGSPAVVAGD